MWHESYLQPFFPGMHQLSSYFYVIFKNLQSIPKTAFFPFPLSALSSFPFFSRNSYFIFNRRIPREGFDLDFGFTKKNTFTHVLSEKLSPMQVSKHPFIYWFRTLPATLKKKMLGSATLFVPIFIVYSQYPHLFTKVL